MAANLRQADPYANWPARNAPHAVNPSFRYFPLYNFIAETIASGEIGKPLHIRCLRAGVNAPNVGWSPGADWFVSRSANGGILMDIAVHMGDLLLWYFGGVEKV